MYQASSDGVIPLVSICCGFYRWTAHIHEPNQAASNGHHVSITPVEYLPSIPSLIQYGHNARESWIVVMESLSRGCQVVELDCSTKSPSMSRHPTAASSESDCNPQHQNAFGRVSFILAHILEALKEEVRNQTKGELSRVVISCTCALTLKSRSLIAEAAALARLECAAVVAPQFPVGTLLATDTYLIQLPFNYCIIRVNRNEQTWWSVVTWAWLMVVQSQPPHPRRQTTKSRKQCSEAVAIGSTGEEYALTSDELAGQLSAWANALALRHYDEWPKREFLISALQRNAYDRDYCYKFRFPWISSGGGKMAGKISPGAYQVRTLEKPSEKMMMQPGGDPESLTEWCFTELKSELDIIDTTMLLSAGLLTVRNKRHSGNSPPPSPFRTLNDCHPAPSPKQGRLQLVFGLPNSAVFGLYSQWRDLLSSEWRAKYIALARHLAS